MLTTMVAAEAIALLDLARASLVFTPHSTLLRLGNRSSRLPCPRTIDPVADKVEGITVDKADDGQPDGAAFVDGVTQALSASWRAPAVMIYRACCRAISWMFLAT